MIVAFFALNIISAQNQNILYDFDQLPQTLLLNPGAEVDYNKHVGIPLMSNIFGQVGATNTFGNFSDLDVNKGDFFKLNQQIEVVNAGFRFKNPSYYLSFGMYSELDGGGNIGNGNIDQKYFKGDLSGIFHVGISKRMNNRLTIGTRLKFISGNLNASEQINPDEYHIGFSNPNYLQYFKDLGILFDSSGISIPGTNTIFDGIAKLAPSLFFAEGAGMGMGIDFGFTYRASKNITVMASALDLDFIPYSNKYIIYVFDENSSNNKPSYTEEFNYNAFRSPRINASVKYKFYKNKRDRHTVFRNVYCDYNAIRDVSTDEVGIQAYSYFGKDKIDWAGTSSDYSLEKIDWAATAYYIKDFNKYLSAKLTYTYNKYYAKNIGLGVSTHINLFNLYFTVDNLLNLPQINDSKYQTFQFGMNLIFE